jgi:bifunctional non-homologous end joining protein LigD
MAKMKARPDKPHNAERLATYEAKRHFDITPEPDGSSQAHVPSEKKTAAAAKPDGLEFVVQKHDARRLHYDVRLEIEGAMASWAVPKGPSFDPAVKRLAVHVEDHPMQYNAFEGRIPDGQYGAGDVLIWDEGTYETVPPGQERAMLEKGHLHVRLFGQKLVGDWHLVLTGKDKNAHGAKAGGARAASLDDGAGGKGQAAWLMFKAKDRYANAAFDVVAARPESVVSGRRGTRGPRRVGASEKGTSARALHELVGEPMLAQTATSIPDAEAWLFEVKYDGYRLVACKAGGEARLYTRKGNDWTARFPAIAEAMAKLRARECVVDGEACAVDAEGRPSFQALQEWLAGANKHAHIGFAAFDLLWLDGRDLRPEPIEARRELLEKLLEGEGAPMSFSRAAGGSVAELLAATRNAGLEGLMAKRKGSPYTSGRSSSWLKLRFDRRQDAVVIGWIALSGNERDMGALALAVVEEGELVYAGRVGTGFTDRQRSDWAKKLRATEQADAPRAARVPRIKGAHWVEPGVVVECVFHEWTADGTMRQPRFVGLREDKDPMDCLKEADIPPVGDERDAVDPPPATASKPRRKPLAPERPPTGSKARSGSVLLARTPTGAKAETDSEVPERTPPSAAPRRNGPSLSNPDKVLFPRDGITKRQIWDYYTAVAPVMLPHLAGRPITMQRYPDGIDGEEWYQHNVPMKASPFVRLVDVGARHDHKKRIVCDSLDTLQWLANLAALTVHTWCSHVPPEATSRAAIDDALALPNYVILDLDPGDGPWSHLVEVALAVRALLEALALESFVKTSGKRGLHVVIPIAEGPTHAQATGFAEQVARAVAKVLPGVATVERMKDKRSGKLYVDFGQNGEGRTIVAPYTIRARDGAVVSTPIAWDDVTEKLDPTRYTIRTVLARIEKYGDLYAGVLMGKQKLPGLTP